MGKEFSSASISRFSATLDAELDVVLPELKHTKSYILRMNQKQGYLYQIILKYY